MNNEIEEQVAVIIQERPALAVIKSVDDANMIAGYRNKVKDLRGRIAAFFRPNIDKAHELHKALLADLKKVDSKPAEVEAACSDLLKAWQLAELARVRKEQEEADRKAQEEANKIARQLAIEQAKADAEAARIAQAKAKADGDKRAMEQAKREAEEAKAQAAAIKAGTVQVIAAPVASVSVAQASKVQGCGMSSTWGAEVTDLKELCKAIGAGKAPVTCVQADMVALNGMMRSTKGQLVIPGVRAKENFSVRSTR